MNINKAIELDEKVIRLDERQKVNEKRLIMLEADVKKMVIWNNEASKIPSIEIDIKKINTKMAVYSGAIIVLWIFVPTLLKIILK